MSNSITRYPILNMPNTKCPPNLAFTTNFSFPLSLSASCQTLKISTLRIPRTFIDSKAYTAAFKPHVLEEVRSSLQSELELRRPGGTSYNVKITDFYHPKEATSATQRVLNIIICDCIDSSNQKQTPLLPWDVVVISERRVKSYDDFSSDRDLQYAILLITPPPKGHETDRDDTGKRLPSNKRYANALVCPQTEAMWERLHNRIKDKKPESIWSIMPLINIATSRRVATALQGIDEQGCSSILNAVLDTSPSTKVQAQLCTDALAACLSAGLNNSQAEAVAKVSGSLTERILHELAWEAEMAEERVAWDQAALAQAALALLAPAGYCAMRAGGGTTMNPYQDSMYALECDDLLESCSSNSSLSNLDSDWFSSTPVLSFTRKKKPSAVKSSSSIVPSAGKVVTAPSSAAIALALPSAAPLAPLAVPSAVSHVTVSEVRAALPKLCNSAIHMIQGPPGTGKTQTITQMCILLAHPRNTTTFLVCAPSNVAVGEIAQRLVKSLVPYEAPRKLQTPEKSMPEHVRLLLPGGVFAGELAAPDLSALQAFPALSSLPAEAASACLSVAVTPALKSWAAATRPTGRASTNAACSSVSISASAASATVVTAAATVTAPAAAGTVQAGQADRGFLRSADVFLLGSEDKVDLTGPLAAIHINVRVRLVLKALGPCWTGVAGNETDCSWDLNVAQLGELLSAQGDASALRCWIASEGVPGRGDFSVWLLAKLHKHYTEMFTALVTLGDHLPTALTAPGWIASAEQVLEALLDFIASVKAASSADLANEFSMPAMTSSDSDPRNASTSECESVCSEASDSTQQLDLTWEAAAATAAAMAIRRVPFCNNLLLSPLGELRDELLSTLPTTLHPGVPRPPSNEWKHVESWLLGGARIVLSTVSAAGSALMKPVPAIDVCIIDEAAQLVEAEVCIVLNQFPATKVLVLVGDHMQLPATVNSTSAKENGYSGSLFERFQVCVGAWWL